MPTLRAHSLVRRCALAGVAVVLAGACGGSGSTAKPQTTQPQVHALAGTAVLHGTFGTVGTFGGNGSGCGTYAVIDPQGLLGASTPTQYDSWRAGADVLVRDQSNAVIGKGSLSDGVTHQDPVGTPGGMRDCTFRFNVPNIPTSATFYQITVGTAPPTTVTRQEAAAAGWNVKIDGSV